MQKEIKTENDISDLLELITDDFNSILKRHGIKHKIVRFMLANPDDLDFEEIQKKIDLMLDQFKINDQCQNQDASKAWICCKPGGRCFLCDIA
jgi:hypothetical protein